MAPLRRKATTTVTRSHATSKKHAIKRKRTSSLTSAQKLSKIVRHIAVYSARHLTQFESARNPNPLVAQCAAINTAKYSWAPAKARHQTQNERINKAATRTKRQYSTAGLKTRVWVPRWPNENPAVADKEISIPEDKHEKSREAIVRIVQDQEDATKAVFKVMKRSLKCLPKLEVKALMREHFDLALRLQGIEVIDWEVGCVGWKMEVFFQEAESWKGNWGLL